MAVRCYVFDNAAIEARARFEVLPLIFDPGTFRHLAALGVGVGWRCLEIGAGSGSGRPGSRATDRAAGRTPRAPGRLTAV
jgi:hypothetical protein